MNDDLPLIPLYRRTLTWVMRPNIDVVQWPSDVLELRWVRIVAATSTDTMTISHFSFPTTVHFGAGASKLAGVHLRDRGLRRPLIVTDKALAALPVMKHFVAHLDTGLDVGIFNGVQGNPTAAQVMAGQAAYKAHRADCVIGFGGGAALDVAKVVALMAVHDGHVMEYVWDHPQVKPIVNELPYFIALPTTSGTGSEVGRSSVVSDDATHVKRVVFSPKLLAQGRVRRSRADVRPAARRHRGHRHGRADPQHRVATCRPPTTRCATASRWKACASARGRWRRP